MEELTLSELITVRDEFAAQLSAVRTEIRARAGEADFDAEGIGPAPHCYTVNMLMEIRDRAAGELLRARLEIGRRAGGGQ